MSDDRAVVLRAISWRDLCPWFVIFRTFDLSIRLPVLVLATCGVFLTPMGWRGAELLFVSKQVKDNDAPFAGLVAYNSGWTAAKEETISSPSDTKYDSEIIRGVYEASPIKWVASQFIRPYWHFFTASEMSVTKLAYLAFGILWTLAIWGFVGGAITRMAVVQFGRDETVEMRDACRFALGRLRSYILAPLFPLAGVALVLLPSFCLGVLMRLNLGVLLAGFLWPLVLLGGLIITLLLLGLLLSWPLMWVVISGEEAGDEFEALHRSYSFIFQRPWHYLFYATLALLFGSVCWFVADRFAEAVIYFGHWATSWGMTHNLATVLIDSSQANPATASTKLGYGLSIIGWWDGTARAIAIGYGYGFFWCAASAVYLLLRRDVDDTEFDEVFIEGEDEPRSLPPLKVDSAGVPAMVDTPPPTPSASSSTTDSSGEASQG